MCFGLFRFVRGIRRRAAVPDRPAKRPDERAAPELRHIQISLDSMDRHAVISAATCHVMSHILLLAGESQGARLKSDLESIGHSVSRLAWNHDRIALPDVGAQPGYPADLVVVDDAFPGRLPNRIQRMLRPPASRITPVLLITDEARVADIDFFAGITDFITQPYTLAQLETRLRLILGARGTKGRYPAGRPGHQSGALRSPRQWRPPGPHAERVRTAEVSGPPPGSRLYALGPARPHLGVRLSRRHAYGGRARRPAQSEAGRLQRRDFDGTRGRLRFRLAAGPNLIPRPGPAAPRDLRSWRLPRNRLLLQHLTTSKTEDGYG